MQKQYYYRCRNFELNLLFLKGIPGEKFSFFFVVVIISRRNLIKMRNFKKLEGSFVVYAC